MSRVKWINEKSILRLFGVALILAPLINSLLLLTTLRNLTNPWTWSVLMEVLNSQSPINKILSGTSVVLGVLALFGHSIVWNYSLFLIGTYVLVQVPQLGRALQSGWLSISSFLANGILFMLLSYHVFLRFKKTQWMISSRIFMNRLRDFFKQYFAQLKPALTIKAGIDLAQVRLAELKTHLRFREAELPAAEESTAKKESSQGTLISENDRIKIVEFETSVASPAKKERSIYVRFTDLNWIAKLVKVSPQGMQFRSVSGKAKIIFNKPIELTLTPSLKIRVKLQEQTEDNYFFEFLAMNQIDMDDLNLWLRKG